MLGVLGVGLRCCLSFAFGFIFRLLKVVVYAKDFSYAIPFDGYGYVCKRWLCRCMFDWVLGRGCLTTVFDGGLGLCLVFKFWMLGDFPICENVLGVIVLC